MPSAPSTARVAFDVAAMEIRSGLRDRQAVVYAVLLPLALYPVLFWVMLQGALVVEGERERTEVAVAVAGGTADARGRVAAALERPAEDLATGPARVEPRLELADEDGAASALRSGEVDLVVALEPDGARLYYDGSKSRSMLARARGTQRLGALAERERVEAVGEEALEPFRLERVPLATGAEESAFVLSLLLPMMFCTMTVLGAFFPAIDLSAGEKERGTAETTLVLPVPRAAVLCGKVLAVSFFALLATLLNALGLLIAAEHLLAGLGGAGFELEVPWSAFPLAAPFLLGFVVSTSALLFAAASFTDTFKQGQSMLGAVQMIVLVPAILVSMPGVDLSPVLALVPVAQTALAFKAILRGDAGAQELALVALSQAAYAVLAVWIVLRLAGGEARLLAGSAGRSGLGALLRRRGGRA